MGYRSAAKLRIRSRGRESGETARCSEMDEGQNHSEGHDQEVHPPNTPLLSVMFYQVIQVNLVIWLFEVLFHLIAS